jgi:hypothetical protein
MNLFGESITHTHCDAPFHLSSCHVEFDCTIKPSNLVGCSNQSKATVLPGLWAVRFSCCAPDSKGAGELQNHPVAADSARSGSPYGRTVVHCQSAHAGLLCQLRSVRDVCLFLRANRARLEICLANFQLADHPRTWFRFLVTSAFSSTYLLGLASQASL